MTIDKLDAKDLRRRKRGGDLDSYIGRTGKVFDFLVCLSGESACC